MILKFTCGPDKEPVYLNTDNIVELKRGETDCIGPTTKIITTKFDSIFRGYYCVDGNVEDHIDRINEAINNG
jgi:hypothetical protein